MVVSVPDSRNRDPRFESRPELPLISLRGSLAGPCNPMRLGHDCYNTQVRSVISCIRKGKNEVIQVPRIDLQSPCLPGEIGHYTTRYYHVRLWVPVIRLPACPSHEGVEPKKECGFTVSF